MIQLQNISKSFGLQELFKDVTFQVGAGERIGLAGRNGSGKSTLFKIILGQEAPDGGQINIPKGYSLGHLEQHLRFNHPTVLTEACSALKVNEEGWTEEHRAQAILFGLGFSQKDMERPPSELSGGFQIRLNLAKVLVAEPSMLLLDEPTNYLDIVSVRWLERFLLSWKGELMLITHDRRFMNRVCTHTIGIHRGTLRKIPGSVEKLMETILLEEEVQMRTLENETRKREQLERFIERFRAQATKATAVQSRIKALDRKAPIQKLGAIRNLDFAFTAADFPGKRMMQLQDLSFRWNEHGEYLLQKLDLEIFKGDRIAVIGPNGRGKTTLLNLIAKELSPSTGQVSWNPNVLLGYFGQTNIQRLDAQKTVEEEIQSAVKDGVRGRARSLAGAMMFEGDAALKQVRILSGGERSRVLLAKILATSCNLLLLDEPTNHLDMESVDSLVEAIDDYTGTVVFVSHDEGLLHALANRLIVFDGGRVFIFEGSYGEFLERVGWSDESESKKDTSNTVKSKEDRRQRANYVIERARMIKPVEKRISDSEHKISQLEGQLSNLEQDLVQASDAGNGARIAELAQLMGQVQTQISKAYSDWESSSAELETLLEQYPLSNP